jgi:hypothetical protein
MADKPVQHTPKHLEQTKVVVVDARHPAASAFAPLQPAADVVADDVEERGQNLRGGPKASAAQKTYKDQPQKLVEQREASPRTAAPVAAGEVEGDTAKPADAKKK